MSHTSVVSAYRALDGSHPEEQGLKQVNRLFYFVPKLLDGSHPEEQGLKHHPVQARQDAVGLLDGSHPEEQGLKPFFIASSLSARSP